MVMIMGKGKGGGRFSDVVLMTIFEQKEVWYLSLNFIVWITLYTPKSYAMDKIAKVHNI